jgi:parvulin-like peptidyl-prolyl isomerase
MASKENKQLTREENPFKGEWTRRFKANPFVFIGTFVVLIIVIVAFVVVPAIVPEAGGPSMDLNFGSYDTVPISYVPGNYFANVYGNISRYYQQYLQGSNFQGIEQTIWRQAFEETVIHTAILQEMKKAGYTAPEKVVDREVATLPQFQENGRFSVTRYRRLDKTARLALWREVQESITKDRYREDVMSLRTPAGEGAFIRDMTRRQRSFGLAVFPLDSYPNDEIVKYVASNPELFRSSHLSRITINSSEREARQVLNSIKAGTQTFEEAAQSQSQDSYADRGGDMGIRMAYEFTSEVPDSAERETVLNTPPGELSPVVKVPSGWAFFRAEQAMLPAEATIGDTAKLDKIRSYMTSFQRGIMEDWLFGEARLLISAVEEKGFDAAVEESGVQKYDFGPLPLNYGGLTMNFGGLNLFPTISAQSISQLIPAESNAAFWQAAFFTPLEHAAEPLVIGDNVLVLYPREETTKDTNAPSDSEGTEGPDLRSDDHDYSTWVSNNAETSLRSYFINSEKLNDRFFATYLQYLYQPNQPN